MKKVIIVLFIFLIGCIGTVTRTSAPRSQYLQTPKELSELGDFTHKSSGMVFPKKIEGFDRVNITQYDIGEYDVSVGYNYLSPKGNLVCTVYVYPAPKMTYIGSSKGSVDYLNEKFLSNEIEKVITEILHYNQNWKKISDGVSKL